MGHCRRQAVRNLDDLECLACPPKYRDLKSFYKYYAGELQAPYLTLFSALLPRPTRPPAARPPQREPYFGSPIAAHGAVVPLEHALSAGAPGMPSAGLGPGQAPQATPPSPARRAVRASLGRAAWTRSRALLFAQKEVRVRPARDPAPRVRRVAAALQSAATTRRATTCGSCTTAAGWRPTSTTWARRGWSTSGACASPASPASSTAATTARSARIPSPSPLRSDPWASTAACKS